MASEIKNKVRPLYSEFQGYLSQAPTASKLNEAIFDESFWRQYNTSVDLLSAKTNEDYGRFKIEPIRDPMGLDHIYLDSYRQKISGLISNLHGEYFSDEPAPFSGMPGMVISQTQHQNVSVQMLLDFQSQIDDTLKTINKDSKEEGFLNKLKKRLGSMSNVNELLKESMRLAKDFGLTVQDILSLWGG